MIGLIWKLDSYSIEISSISCPFSGFIELFDFLWASVAHFRAPLLRFLSEGWARVNKSKNEKKTLLPSENIKIWNYLVKIKRKSSSISSTDLRRFVWIYFSILNELVHGRESSICRTRHFFKDKHFASGKISALKDFGEYKRLIKSNFMKFSEQ